MVSGTALKNLFINASKICSFVLYPAPQNKRKQQIDRAIEDGKNYGYELDATRYFFVDKFYETGFKKITPRAPMGSRVFDLTQILETEKLPGTQEITELLNDKTWS